MFLLLSVCSFVYEKDISKIVSSFDETSMLCLVTLQLLHKISFAVHHDSTALYKDGNFRVVLRIFSTCLQPLTSSAPPPQRPQLWGGAQS